MIFNSFVSVNDYNFPVQITEKRSSSKTSNDTSGTRKLQRVQCLRGKVQVKQKKKLFFFLFCGNYLEIDWRCQNGGIQQWKMVWKQRNFQATI